MGQRQAFAGKTATTIAESTLQRGQNPVSRDDRSRESSSPLAAGHSWWIFFFLFLMVAAGRLAFLALKPRPLPPPPAIANDPLLVEGREIYVTRCSSCHGGSGKGDGPIASFLKGPPPGDLTDAKWKHGDRPAQVLRVISQGVPDTAMSGWTNVYSEEQVRALAAYVYHLAGRHVPEELRGK
jgi:cytochrome c oxidase cbb3-type subunit 3